MERYKLDKKDIIIVTIVYAIIMAVLMLFSSCSQIKYIPQKEIVTKDSIVTKFVHDSIEVKVKEYVKGDTIRYDSIVYQYKFLRDTIKIQRLDSIPYEVEVIKEVERKRNAYENTMIRLGWSFIAVILAFLGYKGIKLYLKAKLH